MNVISPEKRKAIIEGLEINVPIRLITDGENVSRNTVRRYARQIPNWKSPTISESMKEYWRHTGRERTKFPFKYY